MKAITNMSPTKKDLTSDDTKMANELNSIWDAWLLGIVQSGVEWLWLFPTPI